MNGYEHTVWILLLPLIGFVLLGLFGKKYFNKSAGIIGTALLTISAALALLTAYQYFFVNGLMNGVYPKVQALKFTWLMFSPGLSIDMGIMLDPISVMMLVVVTFVSLMVHIFSLGYMKGEERFATYYAFLGLFTFSMLALVVSSNLFQMYMFWELVGVSSYLLIGFYFQKPSAVAASKKAFIVTRFADLGFLIGILILAYYGRSLDFNTIIQTLTAQQSQGYLAAVSASFLGVSALTWGLTLVFMGGAGKSAMFPLHVWLPDAMEGPTPVSALIHAATMVTAGVFLVCRASPMFQLAPFALEFVTVVGATTAFFAASVGLFQNDIKRVIAYSTCSQLGYMFAAAGVAAYNAAMFHLFTHAFFKALLFLGAGSVIHAMHHEQDMRKMGGLWKAIPFTWAMMMIGTLALTGVGLPLLHIGFAGFYSKDAIINSTFAAHTGIGSYAFTLLLVAAGMTSFYSWRQFLMTFHGPYRGDAQHGHHHAAADDHGDGHGEHHHAPKLSEVHESPLVMLGPLAVRARGVVFPGMGFFHCFLGEGARESWRGSLVLALGEEGHLPLWVEFGPPAVPLIGFLVAFCYYILHPALTAAIQARRGMLYLFLYNKWYFDELYDFLFVRPALRLGRFLWKRGDGTVIDGLGPDGIAARVLDATRGAVRLQTGYIYHYALAMLLGVVALATWFMVSGGGL